MGDHEKAFADNTMAISLDPNSAVGWLARGNAYYLLGRFDEALADLKRSVAIDATDQQAQQLLDLAQAKVKETVDRQRVTETTPDTVAITLPAPKPDPAEPKPDFPAQAPEPVAQVETPAPKPEPPPPPPPKPAETAAPAPQDAEDAAIVHHMRARKLIDAEQFREAIGELNEAIRLDSGLSLAYNARGYAYLRLLQYKEAVADFDRAIRLNSAYANAYQNRSTARRRLGDKAGADADWAKWQELTKK
jgi:tetratricopeptide (TPR) repeat protein